MMTQKEQDILAKYENGTITNDDINEHRRIRNITKAKLRKKQ